MTAPPDKEKPPLDDSVAGPAFTRRRPPHQPATAFQTRQLEMRLLTDPSYKQLGRTARHVLLIAALRFANASGRFWPKIATLCEATGYRRSAVMNALRDAIDRGIITRESYLRPKGGGQGSSIYTFDRRFMGADDKGSTETDTLRSDSPHKGSTNMDSLHDLLGGPAPRTPHKGSAEANTDKVATPATTNRERSRATSQSVDERNGSPGAIVRRTLEGVGYSARVIREVEIKLHDGVQNPASWALRVASQVDDELRAAERRAARERERSERQTKESREAQRRADETRGTFELPDWSANLMGTEGDQS